jgi:hypothetical protein
LVFSPSSARPSRLRSATFARSAIDECEKFLEEYRKSCCTIRKNSYNYTTTALRGARRMSRDREAESAASAAMSEALAGDNPGWDAFLFGGESRRSRRSTLDRTGRAGFAETPLGRTTSWPRRRRPPRKRRAPRRSRRRRSPASRRTSRATALESSDALHDTTRKSPAGCKNPRGSDFFGPKRFYREGAKNAKKNTPRSHEEHKDKESENGRGEAAIKKIFVSFVPSW